MANLPTTTPADVQIGSCKVTYNSVDMGGVSGAITVSFQLETLEHRSEQFNMLEEIFVTFRGIRCTVPVNESDLTQLQYGFADGTYSAGAGKAKIKVGGSNVRMSTYSHQLKLEPVYADDDNEDVTIYKAVVTQAVEVSFGMSVRMWPLVFVGMRDSTRTDGDQLFLLGDSTSA